ncbi:putative hydroxybutyrate dehydrogenase [Hypoxylon sp. FL1150]|nr:putative hydroxybutyrate dehydrogenase [Hypoxylon sp. FL1150]
MAASAEIVLITCCSDGGIDDIKAAVEVVTKHTGGTLNYLVNIAGRNHFMPVRDLFEINFHGPIALTQAFAPLLIKASGMVVFITSISGYVNVPYIYGYRSLMLVAETLRLELAPFGVDALEVVTGAVKTLGQTYFGDLKLPAESLYKSIEDTFVSRAQGNDQLPRMDTITGRLWYGNNAEMVKMSTPATSVPQSALDAGATIGTDLDALAK